MASDPKFIAELKRDMFCPEHKQDYKDTCHSCVMANLAHEALLTMLAIDKAEESL